MLPKKSRLRSREDFERVFRKGKSIFLGEVLCLFAHQEGKEKGSGRVGVAFKGKAFPRAATRHLYKRKMLEALRPSLESIPSGIDLILLFQKKLPSEAFEAFQAKERDLRERLNQKI